MSIVTVNMMYVGIFIIMFGFTFCIGMAIRKNKCVRELREKELLEMQLQERAYKKCYRRKDRLYR